jgi:hypothetical protein
MQNGTASDIYTHMSIYTYICIYVKFTALTEAKLQGGLFTGPDIRKLLSGAASEGTVDATEKAAR